MSKYIILVSLFFFHYTFAQKTIDTIKTASDTNTTSNFVIENPYLLDACTWAGLGIGIHFENQGPVNERMLIMLTTEYRLESIPSFLMEFQWWNADGGKKKSFVISGEIKARLYIGNVNIFLQGGIGYATSFPVNFPIAAGIEFTISKKVRTNLQMRYGLSNFDSAPFFLMLTFIKTN